jgi:RNA polymerase sigma-70 factor (ECF subfamily)
MNTNSTQFAVSNDLDLVHASKKGDAAAFEQLVKRYDCRLLRISQTVTRNREDSEDAVQEALLKAFQNLAEFREESQFSTWLIRITVNQSLMKLRKQRIQKEVSLDEEFQADGDVFPVDVPDSAPNPEQLCWASELRHILVRTVEELRPILRTVFVLRDVEGLSIEQTAQVLTLSQAAVKARLWRVRIHLRERLNRYLDERVTDGRLPECGEGVMALRPACEKIGLRGVGWHSFRHTYRTLIDDIGTPLGVQQRLMRHADIKTTMNTYGSAFEKTKRRANSRVADLVLPPAIKSQPKDRAKEVSLKNLRPETVTIQ